jgi:RHS repeat-associated protein
MDPWFGRVTNIDLVDNAQDTTHIDETTRTYDLAGNASTGFQVVTGDGPDGGTVTTRIVQSRSYYGHDNKLRAFQEYDDHPSTTSANNSSGVWEEYRYDPLGRRVAVRTLREHPLCNVDSTTCISATTYFVWSGDQLLWELKTATGSKASEAGGTVSYAHAGGIDRPLVIWKSGVGSIVTHQNWRGQFARGTWGAGSTKIGQSSDCTIYPPSGCVPVPWPGWNTTAWHEDATDEKVIGYKHYWLGSLATGMRDASGQLYRRNRYYDPQTGQFTQVDPIGLAGGLNTYGFAAGDPVSYSDPYGLSAQE